MATAAALKRILAVEDDEVYRELLVMGLRSEGFEVLAAENGIKAQELLASVQPDLIILDILMPLMDGLHFLRWLREDAKLALPALVLTCLDDRSFAVEALVAGASDVLTKPVHLETLVGKIECLLERSASGP